jgi:hypothetical protein
MKTRALPTYASISVAVRFNLVILMDLVANAILIGWATPYPAVSALGGYRAFSVLVGKKFREKQL